MLSWKNVSLFLRSAAFLTYWRALCLLPIIFATLINSSAQDAQQHLPTLTTARQTHSLTLAEANRAYPVHLRAVVTYYDAYIDRRRAALFIHDETGGVFVALSSLPSFAVQAGDLVDVLGVSGPGDFAPIVDRASLAVLGKSQLPNVAPLVSRSHLLTGAEDGQWVEIEGIVRSVRRTKSNFILNVAGSDGIVAALTTRESEANYDSLVDAKVRLRGADGPVFNTMRQMTDTHIFFPGMEAIRLEEPAPADPFHSPVQAVNNLLRFDPDIAFRHRAHVRGRVTMFWSGRLICIQDETQGLCAQTAQTIKTPTGKVIDLLGFPTTGDFRPTLTDSDFLPTGRSQDESAPLITQPIRPCTAIMTRN